MDPVMVKVAPVETAGSKSKRILGKERRVQLEAFFVRKLRWLPHGYLIRFICICGFSAK
jgi:hypothetical protein